MKFIFFLQLSTLFVASNAWVWPPVLTLNVSGQTHKFLIDLNGHETYLVKDGVRKSDYGYKINRTDFEESSRKFHYFVKDANQYVVDANGTYGTATVSDDRFLDLPQTRATFGLIEEVSGEPTLSNAFDNDRSGRIGLNYRHNGGQTNLAQVAIGSTLPYFSYLQFCFDPESPGSCYTNWHVDKCHTDSDINNDAIRVKTVPNEDNFWRTEFINYKVGQISSNRPFNVTFSTTTSNFHVPVVLFKSIASKVRAVTDKNGEYIYDCGLQNQLPNITFMIESYKTLTVKAEIYGDKYKNRCTLRLRPVEGNSWVLGLPWFQAYATCFKPDQTILFNTMPMHRSKIG